jgi:ADP-heptose:LPS heptosyltransferase
MRILIARLGAYGDTLITTPLIRYLKQQGHEIYYLTSDNGRTILENNPNVDKLIFHERDSVPNTKLGEYFEATKKLYECDQLIDLCESIEINLAFSPSQPQSKYPKFEKMAIANRNYYEETFEFTARQVGDYGRLVMGWKDHNLNPEMFFTEQEEKFIEEDIRIPYMGKKKILWGLSGSSRQKTYPPEYMVKVIQAFPDYIHITVGEEVCRLLEWPFSHVSVKDQFPNVVTRAAKFTMRESILACKYVDLVIAPDTGLLHGSGCFDTPKIGLLTNTSRENITKHFKNDYSLEAENVACAPCFNLIYDANVQAQTDEEDVPLCMKWGHPPERLIKRIKEVFDDQNT